MEKDDENVLAQEPLDDEDPNVANLLLSKSERAPAADAETVTGTRPATAGLKTATIAFVAGIVIWRLTRRLFSKSRRYRGGMY